MKYILDLLLVGCSTAVLHGCSYETSLTSHSNSLRQTIHFAGSTLPSHLAVSSTKDSIAKATLPNLANDASLQQCLVFASLNSPELKAAFHTWKGSLSRIPQVSALADPKISLGYFIEEVQTRTGPTEQQLSLTQSFPWWGLLEAKGDVATATAKSNWHRYEMIRLDIFEKIANRWTAVVDLESEIIVVNESFKLLAEAERIARRSYEVDKTSHDKLVRLQVELGKLEDKLIKLENLRGPRLSALNATLGRKSDTKLRLPSSITLSPNNITLDEAQLLISNSPLISSQDATIQEHSLGIRVAELDAKPKWIAGITYTNLGTPLDPTVPEAGNNPIMGMVGFSIPLNQTKTDAAKDEAISKHLSAIASKEAMLHTLHAAIAEAIYLRDDSLRRIEFYESALVPRAEDALSAALAAFSTGKTSAIELLDSQRTLLELQRNLQRSYAAALNADATISKLIGGTTTMESIQ